MGEGDADRSLRLGEAPATRRGPPDQPDQVIAAGLGIFHQPVVHVSNLVQSEHGLAKRFSDRFVRAALDAWCGDETEIAPELEWPRFGRLIHRVLGHELAPALRGGGPSLLEQGHCSSAGLHRKVGYPTPFRVEQLVLVLPVVLTDLALRDGLWSRRRLSYLAEQLVTQDLPDALLRPGRLVELAAPGLLGQELSLDELFQQLLLSLFRLIPETLEPIHAFEGGYVVQNSEIAISDASEDPLRQLGRQATRTRCWGLPHFGLGPTATEPPQGEGQAHQESELSTGPLWPVPPAAAPLQRDVRPQTWPAAAVRHPSLSGPGPGLNDSDAQEGPPGTTRPLCNHREPSYTKDAEGAHSLLAFSRQAQGGRSEWVTTRARRRNPSLRRTGGRSTTPGVDKSGNPKLRYERVIVKMSGEALAGEGGGSGIDTTILKATATELAEVHATGVQIGIVVGGGNIFRGLRGASEGMDRAQSDYMGMLATVINALALQDSLERRGVATRVMTAMEINNVAEPYIRRRAIRHLERGHIVIFAAGTGNPYFSTDTAAALRAMEIRASALFKATKVDGIYDRDPKRFPGAKRLTHVSYDRFLSDHLGVMDSTAVALCRENGLPIRVFQAARGNIRAACLGEPVGTTISTDASLQ